MLEMGENLSPPVYHKNVDEAAEDGYRTDRNRNRGVANNIPR